MALSVMLVSEKLQEIRDELPVDFVLENIELAQAAWEMIDVCEAWMNPKIIRESIAHWENELALIPESRGCGFGSQQLRNMIAGAEANLRCQTVKGGR